MRLVLSFIFLNCFCIRAAYSKYLVAEYGLHENDIKKRFVALPNNFDVRRQTITELCELHLAMTNTAQTLKTIIEAKG